MDPKHGLDLKIGQPMRTKHTLRLPHRGLIWRLGDDMSGTHPMTGRRADLQIGAHFVL
jgi:hypothetical protein